MSHLLNGLRWLGPWLHHDGRLDLDKDVEIVIQVHDEMSYYKVIGAIKSDLDIMDLIRFRGPNDPEFNPVDFKYHGLRIKVRKSRG